MHRNLVHAMRLEARYLARCRDRLIAPDAYDRGVWFHMDAEPVWGWA